MPNVSRFASASSSLTLRDLLSRARRGLWISLGVGVAFHLALGSIAGSDGDRKGAKPLTTQFVKRQPRLTKPLELKKRPRPRQRAVKREMVAVKARVERGDAPVRFQPTRLLGGLARPSAQIGRLSHFEGLAVEPVAIAEGIQGIKEDKHAIDMSLELMDTEAMDTGKYRALVVQDPGDKRNIKGFVHLALGYSTSESSDVHDPEFWEEWKTRRNHAVVRLADAMNKFTMIRTLVAGWLPFTSDELFRCPWVFVTSYRSFRLTDTEASNLGTYLLGGGFVFADFLGTRSGSPRGNHYLRAMVDDALASQGLRLGRGWRTEALPVEHTIFHCFFDFSDGPPIAQEANKGFAYWWGPMGPRPLEGVYVDRRMVALTGEKGYWTAWADWGLDRSGYGHLDPTRQFQFGVNLIVFALTQEGSMTSRVMDSVE